MGKEIRKERWENACLLNHLLNVATKYYSQVVFDR